MATLRYEMAESLVKQREYDAAAPFLRELVKQRPKNARLHLLLGIVLREKGVKRAAEREIRQAIALNSTDAAAYAALGILLMRQHRLEQAEKAHRRAIELAEGTAAYHNDLGFCLLAQRRLEEAREELEEAIRLDPAMRRAYNNLGFAWGLEGEREAALKAFSQAGSHAMALTNMGYVEELRGRPQSARRYYEQALRRQRGFPPALHNLHALDPSRVDEPEDDEEKGFPAEPMESSHEPATTQSGAQDTSTQATAEPMRPGSSGAGRRGPVVPQQQRLHQGAAPGR